MVATKSEETPIMVRDDLAMALRIIARCDGREIEAVLEDAITEYVEAHGEGKVDWGVISAFQTVLEKYRRIHELKNG